MTPLIELNEISHSFGSRPDLAARLAISLKLAKPAARVQAIDRVSLAVRRGEVLGLVGESGCGKSTLGRIVAGIVSPTRGSVSWRGKDM
ncbi:ATP-binding cassette domain-containing protein, partial [Mesorhizobium sp. M5C.F.Ca.IN.020.32.2.1]|uniref:ATP-binding cassette domain-containing protein n=1 Tax=Mesorhizobium sp. M5C.F.Ca.IN.020.32.2.1 TaxID=2496771 RepID=UPI000FD5F45C